MNPLKVVILKDQTHLMGEVIELDEEPMYLIQSCYKLTDDDIVKFPLYTDQRDIFLTSDVIFTIVDPSEETITRYKKNL